MSAHTSSLSGASRTTRTSSRITTKGTLTVLALLLPLAGCGDDDAGAGDARELVTVYTCVSDETIQAVIAGFEDAHPATEVRLFRAPTGELNARIAGDTRSGALRADVVWACDPLTMQAYVDQGLVGGWVPENASSIPEELRTDDYVGAHVLYVVAVHRDDVDPPRSWGDLARPGYTVALPDPSFAASALGALGYLARSPQYGMEFYRALAENGATQVSSPDEVTVGVAQGAYDAGITIAGSAYEAEENGSPVGVVWPEPGAVVVHGPIALAKDSIDYAAAQSFISYIVGEEGQTTVAESGSYPTMEGLEGPTVPEGAPVVLPDWDAIGEEKERLVGEYRQLFGG